MVCEAGGSRVLTATVSGLLVWVMILKKTLPIGGQLMLGY